MFYSSNSSSEFIDAEIPLEPYKFQWRQLNLSICVHAQPPTPIKNYYAYKWFQVVLFRYCSQQMRKYTLRCESIEWNEDTFRIMYISQKIYAFKYENYDNCVIFCRYSLFPFHIPPKFSFSNWSHLPRTACACVQQNCTIHINNKVLFDFRAIVPFYKLISYGWLHVNMEGIAWQLHYFSVAHWMRIKKRFLVGFA